MLVVTSPDIKEKIRSTLLISFERYTIASLDPSHPVLTYARQLPSMKMAMLELLKHKAPFGVGAKIVFDDLTKKFPTLSPSDVINLLEVELFRFSYIRDECPWPSLIGRDAIWHGEMIGKTAHNQLMLDLGDFASEDQRSGSYHSAAFMRLERSYIEYIFPAILRSYQYLFFDDRFLAHIDAWNKERIKFNKIAEAIGGASNRILFPDLTENNWRIGDNMIVRKLLHEIELGRLRWPVDLEPLHPDLYTGSAYEEDGKK
jgi:hypothetical protein